MRRFHVLLLTCLFLLLPVANGFCLIIDLDSQVDTKDSPESHLFSSGYYEVNVIGTADGGAYNAWNPWGNVDGCDADGNCAEGWLNYYGISSTVFTPESSLYGSGGPYRTDLLALTNAVSTNFNLSLSAQVNFWILDSTYSDNTGGISLEVNRVGEPVPEPATILLFAAGIAGLGSARLRRHRR